MEALIWGVCYHVKFRSKWQTGLLYNRQKGSFQPENNVQIYSGFECNMQIIFLEGFHFLKWNYLLPHTLRSVFVGSVGQSDSPSIHQSAWQVLILCSTATYCHIWNLLLGILVPRGLFLITWPPPLLISRQTFSFYQHLHPWQGYLKS